MTADELSPGSTPFRRIPARTILFALSAFWLSFLLVNLLERLTDVITYVVIAIFFAILLTPVVDFFVHKLHFTRGWATLAVFLLALGALSAMVYTFIQPIADRAPEFARSFPSYVDNVKYCGKDYKTDAGKLLIPPGHRCPKGPAGEIITKFHLENKLQNLSEKIASSVQSIKDNAKDIIAAIGRTIAGTLTVFVLVILMLLHGSGILNRFLSPLPGETQIRLKRIGKQCSHAVTGYMFGNVVISIIAGTIALIALAVFGVQFKTALALWVGFADLIPLVGATLGAIPAVVVAFLHSTTAGIGMIVVFIVYQQFENNVLQVTVMSRTVELEPLIVLVSVLIGAQLFGILGALLAIPVASAVQVILRDTIAGPNANIVSEDSAPEANTAES